VLENKQKFVTFLQLAMLQIKAPGLKHWMKIRLNI